MRAFKVLSFILLEWLIIKVLSIEILQKYSSIKTSNDHIVFESKEVSINLYP